jgi:GT2 family glycosyltransferase
MDNSAPPVESSTEFPSQLPSPTNITAVILVYNQGTNACRVIQAVKAQSYPVARILVVDNASPDGSADQIAAAHPDVELVRLQENLGVGAGHNQGWQLALADAACDFIWSLEHDCYPAPSCLSELVEAHNALRQPNSLPPVVAPYQDNPYTQSSRPHILVTGLVVKRLTQLPPAASPIATNGFTFNGTLLPAAVIGAVGWLDERYFFVFEDTDYVIRTFEKGVQIYLVPAARVEHSLFPDSVATNFGRYVILWPGGSAVMRVYYGFRNSILGTLRANSRTSSHRAKLYARFLLYYLLLQLWDLLFSGNRWRRMHARTLALRDGFAGRDGKAKYAVLRAR